MYSNRIYESNKNDYTCSYVEISSTAQLQSNIMSTVGNTSIFSYFSIFCFFFFSGVRNKSNFVAFITLLYILLLWFFPSNSLKAIIFFPFCCCNPTKKKKCQIWLHIKYMYIGNLQYRNILVRYRSPFNFFFLYVTIAA